MTQAIRQLADKARKRSAAKMYAGPPGPAKRTPAPDPLVSPSAHREGQGKVLHATTLRNDVDSTTVTNQRIDPRFSRVFNPHRDAEAIQPYLDLDGRLSARGRHTIA